MVGKMICLFVVTAGILILLLLYAKNKEKDQGKNKKDAVKVMILSGMLGFIICISEDTRARLTSDGKLLRNQAGEGADTQELQLDAEGILKDYGYTLEVQEQRLYGEELEQLFQSAEKEAEVDFLGENPSLNHICHDVSLPKTLQNGQIKTGWQFEPKGIIDEDGKLQPDKVSESGAVVMVSLKLTYYDEVQTYSFGCHVYPKEVSSKEKLLSDLSDYFQTEQEDSKNRPYIRMPGQIDGNVLKWSQKRENLYRIILMLGIIAAAFVYAQQAVRDQKKEQKRKDDLLRQYPDMVSKLSLLLGAGMTFSAAWERIILNYQHQLNQHLTQPMEVYEQMLISYREMQDGIGEIQVYERFGERCGMPQYRKLTMLIIQNLRKGSSGLTQALEKEVAEAFALRKNNAKKAGEEAGTKILLPMMLMLMVVMIIILVPAFLTFQM